MFFVVSCRLRQGKPFWTCSGIVVARVCLKGCLQFSSCHEWKGARGWATVVSPELCRSRLDLEEELQVVESSADVASLSRRNLQGPPLPPLQLEIWQLMYSYHLIATNKKPIAVAGEKRGKLRKEERPLFATVAKCWAL